MNEPEKNRGNADRLSREFFSGGQFRWHKSREEVWADMESRLGDPQPVRIIRMSRIMLSAAAIVLVLIGIGTFLRYYTVKVVAPAGIHQTVKLPDGSKIDLNAVTSVRYHPYFWTFSRSVKLEGEAHFEVTPGKNFKVVSERGTTEVLGTRFNVFAREERYEVTCLTGTVKVISPTRVTAVLLPGSRAEISGIGEIRIIEKTDTYPVISWRDNIFLFTAKPVGEVFEEIERQYNITIHSNMNNQAHYSGNFAKEQQVEEILGYICPALGLKYTQKSAGEYLITHVDE